VILRGPPRPPVRHATLVRALAAAARHPSGVTFVDLQERETFMPWAEVRARAERAAANLVHLGVREGDRVAVVLRTEPAFLDALFGAWLAGAVPVPLYPPVRLGRMDEYLEATGRMIAVSGARLVVSAGGARRLLGAAVERGGPDLGCVDADALRELPARIARDPAPEALGLVQFSSGSTVDPKPVALTHAALGAMIDALLAVTAPDARDVLVSWLPLYHDMGLIGGLLAAMSYPGPLVLIPPEHFLARPALWLRAIGRHRGTISAAPSSSGCRSPPGASPSTARSRSRPTRSAASRRGSRSTGSTPPRSSRCTGSPRRRSPSPSGAPARRSRAGSSTRSPSRATGWSPRGRAR
jgi:acyl-CoA synthetase (AMP-forming)/AMP-acid ligase II